MGRARQGGRGAGKAATAALTLSESPDAVGVEVKDGPVDVPALGRYLVDGGDGGIVRDSRGAVGEEDRAAPLTYPALVHTLPARSHTAKASQGSEAEAGGGGGGRALTSHCPGSSR